MKCCRPKSNVLISKCSKNKLTRRSKLSGFRLMLILPLLLLQIGHLTILGPISFSSQKDLTRVNLPTPTALCLILRSVPASLWLRVVHRLGKSTVFSKYPASRRLAKIWRLKTTFSRPSSIRATRVLQVLFMNKEMPSESKSNRCKLSLTMSSIRNTN